MRILCTAVALLVACPTIDSAQSGSSTSQPTEATRAIIAEEFLKARPKKPAGSPAKQATYRRVTPPSKSSPKSTVVAELGVTVWRLRPSRTSDGQARLLVHQGAEASQWTPERIETGSRVAVGDRLRLAIESPRSGYLYVVDAEQYADGSTGAPEKSLLRPTHEGKTHLFVARADAPERKRFRFVPMPPIPRH